MEEIDWEELRNWRTRQGGTKACQIKGRRVGRGEARGLRQGELASLILRSTSVSLTTLVFFSQLLPAFVPRS